MTNVIDQRAEPDGSVGASRFPARSQDLRGGLPAGGSARAIPSAGPRPASSVPGARPGSHGERTTGSGMQRSTGP